MDLVPLWAEAPPIPSHAMAAFAALALGAAQFLLPKGTALHRGLGYAWILSMAYVALSSFAIYELRLIGPFSPIHGLSVLTLVSLVQAIRAARQGNIAQHQRIMRSLYFLALIVTGLFTLLPGRAMHTVVFGG
ncbi:MAG: DUF2306 domain-containing protein [Pseudomonadota bacterium]